MTTRRRLLGTGPSPATHSARGDLDGPAAVPRVHAPQADLSTDALYRPDIALDELRARGVLGGPLPVPGPHAVTDRARELRPRL